MDQTANQGNIVMEDKNAIKFVRLILFVSRENAENVIKIIKRIAGNTFAEKKRVFLARQRFPAKRIKYALMAFVARKKI